MQNKQIPTNFQEQLPIAPEYIGMINPDANTVSKQEIDEFMGEARIHFNSFFQSLSKKGIVNIFKCNGIEVID